MKIYAIRDRMIDYFQDPFPGPSDNAVMASLANIINNGETTNALAQAPHHFEIWRLAEIDEQGHIHAQREFLGDCSSLIRADRDPARSTATAATAAAQQGGIRPRSAPSAGPTSEQTSGNAAPRQNLTPEDLGSALAGSGARTGG